MQLLEITPSMAMTWLKTNKLNRPILSKHVIALADEIKSNKWKVNGETIKFNKGQLTDGQHRLSACILSGVTFRSYVVYETEDNSFDTIDVGAKRTSGAILSINGVKSYNNVAAIIKGYLEYQKTNSFSTTSINITAREILEEYNKTPDYYKLFANEYLMTSKFINSVFFSVCRAAFDKYGQSWFEPMITSLKTGENLYRGNPVLTLREWAINNKGQTKRQAQRAIYVKVIKAVIAGKELKIARYTDQEKFPEL